MLVQTLCQLISNCLVIPENVIWNPSIMMTDNQNSSLRYELLSRAEVSCLVRIQALISNSWEQETIFYGEAKHLFLQSLYWRDCAVSEMPKTSRTLCGSDCGQTSTVRTHAWCQSIWTDGGETWTSNGGRVPATGGAWEAIKQIMIVNNIGTHPRQVRRGEVEQDVGNFLIQICKCRLYIIHMFIRASLLITWNYKNHVSQCVWKWILTDVCVYDVCNWDCVCKLHCSCITFLCVCVCVCVCVCAWLPLAHLWCTFVSLVPVCLNSDGGRHGTAAFRALQHHLVQFLYAVVHSVIQSISWMMPYTHPVSCPVYIYSTKYQ